MVAQGTGAAPYCAFAPPAYLTLLSTFSASFSSTSGWVLSIAGVLRSDFIARWLYTEHAKASVFYLSEGRLLACAYSRLEPNFVSSANLVHAQSLGKCVAIEKLH
jgi:hypothetical protein